MFTAAEMNRISNGTVCFDTYDHDWILHIENELIDRAFYGHKCATVFVDWENEELDNVIQSVRNYGYDVEIKPEGLFIRW
jgi:hypothetical protein